VAAAFRVLGLTAHAVGDPGAPERQSTDKANCEWCRANQAILITNDRGKKDKTILDHLAELEVDAIFVYNDLRFAPDHQLARAVLSSEKQMDEIASGRSRLRHRLRAGGGLAKR
jgi:hypothetical protein